MVWLESVFVPFQGLVAIVDVATDFSQQLDPARESFHKNVTWETRDLEAAGEAVPPPDLSFPRF